MGDHVVQFAGDPHPLGSGSGSGSGSGGGPGGGRVEFGLGPLGPAGQAAMLWRRTRLSVPATKAVPKMYTWKIVSYGCLCPGSVCDHASPMGIRTTMIQRATRPLRSATVATAMAFASGSGAYPNAS
jgi:hypothetical protein